MSREPGKAWKDAMERRPQLPEGTRYAANRGGDQLTFSFLLEERIPGWVALLRFAKTSTSVDLVGAEVTYFGDLSWADGHEIDDRVRLVLEGDYAEWVQLQAQRTPDYPVPPGGLTIRRLQGVRIGHLQTIARSYLSEAVDSGFVEREWSAKPSDRPGQRGKSDLFYAELAAKYVELLNRGCRNPVETLAEEGWALATVRNQLLEARRRGLLTSAGKGRMGGHLTDHARDLLERRDA